MQNKRISLIETFEFKPTLVESSDSGLLKVRGVFQRYDQVNANGRLYSKKIFEKILSSKTFQERLKKRAVVGILEHPEDGQTRLDRISHVNTKVWDDGKGYILGESEVLGTTNGKELKALFEGNVMVGISSRGSGSVTEKDGVQHVNEDYEVETWDFVYNNSVEGANPVPVTESKVTVESPAKTTEPPLKEKKLMENGRVDRSSLVRKMKRKVSNLISTQVETLPFDRRAELLENIESKRIKLDRWASEDPSVKTIAEKVHVELADFEKKIKAVEEGKDSVKTDYAALKAISEGLIEQNKGLKDQIIALGSKIEELQKVGSSKSEGLFEKRYSALKKVCEELVRRVHGANKLAESSLKKAKELRSSNESADAKRYPIAKKIIDGLVERYHVDTIKLLKAGFLTKYPEAKVYEGKFGDCKTLKEATALSQRIIAVLEKKKNGEKVDPEQVTEGKEKETPAPAAARKEPLPGSKVRIPESGSAAEVGEEIHESVGVVQRARARKQQLNS